MRIAAFGAGGVGGYFGGRLAQAGHELVVLARGAHLDAIRREGLRVESVRGDFLVHPSDASADPAAVRPVDAVLVCVKAWQVPEAAAAMIPMLHPASVVAPLVNGVEAAGQLAPIVGKERVLGGLCRIISYIRAPGVVHHAGVDPSVSFGERDGRRTERVEALREAFARAAGLTVSVPDDIEAEVWEKFLFIASFSGVGALTRRPVGEFRAEAGSRAMLEGAMREIHALARTRGVAISADAVERAMAFIDGMPGDSTASMQRDIMEGRPSELENQNGAVVRLAREAGLAAPIHERIHLALHPAEQRARGLA